MSRRLAGVLAVLLAGCSVPGAERMFFGAETVARPEAEDCERCHQEVYREWRGSAHARAWTSERFQQASLHGRSEPCAGCHAPAPVDATRPVRVRDVHRDEGVTCLSCHLSTRPGAAPLTMRGPASRTSPVAIHPIVEADPFYRSSDLCGRCHEPELAEWKAAPGPGPGEKEACQECHMPAVRRKVESVHDEHGYSAVFVALGREQDLRRHDFHVPPDAAEWLELSVRTRPANVLEVRVRNALPHALPTGGFGRRRVRLAARWPGGETTELLAGTLEGRIPAGATRRATLALPDGVAPEDVVVELSRWNRLEETWTSLVGSRSPDGDGG